MLDALLLCLAGWHSLTQVRRPGLVQSRLLRRGLSNAWASPPVATSRGFAFHSGFSLCINQAGLWAQSLWRHRFVNLLKLFRKWAVCQSAEDPICGPGQVRAMLDHIQARCGGRKRPKLGCHLTESHSLQRRQGPWTAGCDAIDGRRGPGVRAFSWLQSAERCRASDVLTSVCNDLAAGPGGAGTPRPSPGSPSRRAAVERSASSTSNCTPSLRGSCAHWATSDRPRRSAWPST